MQKTQAKNSYAWAPLKGHDNEMFCFHILTPDPNMTRKFENFRFCAGDIGILRVTQHCSRKGEETLLLVYRRESQQKNRYSSRVVLRYVKI